MSITRRQAIKTSIAATVGLSSSFLGASRAFAWQSQDDVQFTPPPSPLTDADLELLVKAVECARRATASQLVKDERFQPLHAQPVFRQLVKGIAREPKLDIPHKDEPGSRIIAAGTVVDDAGRPSAGAIAYAYHTSAKGWYSDKAAHIRAWAGDTRHARLFGYLRTGVDGGFEISTIRPGGYPRSTLPQHIHFEVEAAGFEPLATELLFDDDPRLTAEQRKRAQSEGFIIAPVSDKRNGVLTFRYNITLKKA